LEYGPRYTGGHQSVGIERHIPITELLETIVEFLDLQSSFVASCDSDIFEFDDFKHPIFKFNYTTSR